MQTQKGTKGSKSPSANQPDNGGPAFPVPFGFVSCRASTGPNDPIPDKPWINIANGMSLRDWFAGMAMMGYCAKGLGDFSIPRNAYMVADAMLKERNGHETNH